MGVFKFAKISPTSIGYLNATQKLHAFKVDQNITLELSKKFNTQRPIMDVM
jgi:hypothetical protein